MYRGIRKDAPYKFRYGMMSGACEKICVSARTGGYYGEDADSIRWFWR